MSKISRINEEFKKVFSSINEISSHTAWSVAGGRRQQAANIKRDLDNKIGNKIIYGDLDTLHEILGDSYSIMYRLNKKARKADDIGHSKWVKEHE